jgi:hypothetical protein
MGAAKAQNWAVEPQEKKISETKQCLETLPLRRLITFSCITDRALGVVLKAVSSICSSHVHGIFYYSVYTDR